MTCPTPPAQVVRTVTFSRLATLLALLAAASGCRGSAMDTSALPTHGPQTELAGDVTESTDTSGVCLADSDCAPLATTPCSQAICETLSHRCIVSLRPERAAPGARELLEGEQRVGRGEDRAVRAPPQAYLRPVQPPHAQGVRVADDVRGEALPCGHYIPEEAPDALLARVLPFWNERIAPAVKSGQRVLIAAHGNSLRALVKYLDQVGEEEIVGLNIPTAQPLVYELDADLRPIRHYYLADPDEIARAQAAVAAQGKARA